MSECTVFASMTRPEALAEAFLRVKRNRGGAGGDGQTSAVFEADLKRNLAELRRTLLDQSYRPGPLRRYPVEKPTGGVRWISVPCVRCRVAQTAAATALSAAIDPFLSPASFAFRPGLSVESAAGAITTLRLQGFVHVAEGDIASFFDSVPHAVAIDMLRRFARYPFLRLVGLWLQGFSRNGRGLPQGSPLSPALANLVLDPIDKAITSRRVRLVRYADDFVLMARSPEAATFALARMETLLAGIGLALKAEKTRLARIDEGIRFLGLSFEGDGVMR